MGLLLSMGMPASAAPANVQGLVTRVVDGDTLWLTPPGKAPIVIRLHNIDAPESCQAWGPEATAALSTLALNKLATLQIKGKDPHGRTELCCNRRATKSGKAGATHVLRMQTIPAPRNCLIAMCCLLFMILSRAAARCLWKRSGWGWKVTPVT